jgi:hypothetical protein
MLRNRLGRSLDGRRFVRALWPYLIAQLAVLALVLTFPNLLWHDRATLVAPAAGGISDKEIDDLLRRQTEPEDPARE